MSGGASVLVGLACLFVGVLLVTRTPRVDLSRRGTLEVTDLGDGIVEQRLNEGSPKDEFRLRLRGFGIGLLLVGPMLIVVGLADLG